MLQKENKQESISPTVIYCCTGMEHLCYTIWSIRSLLKFGYKKIEVIVSNKYEESFLLEKLPDLKIHIIKVDSGDYPIMGYKPFAMEKYVENVDNDTQREIVICDADVIWKKDPLQLFTRFHNKNWVQKITPLDPNEYLISLKELPLRNIGIVTILNYNEVSKIDVWPNFRLNAGLFMIKESLYKKMLSNWMPKIMSLPPHKMMMSEALMSLTYAEMGLIPVSDKEDIRYKYRDDAGVVHRKSIIDNDLLNMLDELEKESNLNLTKYEYYETKDNEHTGYQVATHYLSDQKDLLHKVALEMGLDDDNLINIVKSEIRKKKIKKILKLPKKIKNMLLSRN